MKLSTIAILFFSHLILGGAALTGLEGQAHGFFVRVFAHPLIFPFGYVDLPPVVSLPANAAFFVVVVWLIVRALTFVRSKKKRDLNN